jgi:translation initiation factor IF-2
MPVAPAAPVAQAESAAELNILEPAQPKVVPAQTWESEGFKPNREPRGERPRREESSERAERPADEPVDIASIPPQFLYVRPGHTYVPTPRNWGGAPRERSERPERSDRPIHGSPERAMETSAEVPAKSGGFLGWLKSLFGGSSSAPAETVPATAGGSGEARREGGHRRHRGGRNRSGGPGGEGRGGRSRGGRGGRGGGGYRSEGSSQGGV